MTKKSFKQALENDNSPAEAFLTLSAPAEPRSGRGSWSHRETYCLREESKSKRVNLLMRPSVYEAAKAAADREGLSFNALVNHLVEDYLEEGERQ